MVNDGLASGLHRQLVRIVRNELADHWGVVEDFLDRRSHVVIHMNFQAQG